MNVKLNCGVGIGSRISINGKEEFIIASAGDSQVNLICLITGSRWHKHPINVHIQSNLTPEEVYVLLKDTVLHLSHLTICGVHIFDVEEEKYKMGDYFDIDGTKYMLACVQNGGGCLVSMEDGNRWSDNELPMEFYQSTKKDIDKYVGPRAKAVKL